MLAEHRPAVVTSRLARLATHAVVLIVAIGLASYSSVNRGLPTNLLRLGVANTLAHSLTQGGQVQDVSLGRDGVVVKPMAVPTAVPVPHSPISYTVLQGDTLKSIAARFNVTVDELRWSNPDLGTAAQPRSGVLLLVPPIAGVVVQARTGDTVQSLAAVWHVDPESIIDFNYLRNPATDLTDGRMLVLPAGRGSIITPTSDATLPAAVGARGVYQIKVGGTQGPYSPHFPFGQCTFYVATKVQIPWHGDAWTWYGSAQAAGWPVGTTPRPGAVMVTWESRVFGHVAYVESINSDGSWWVSEMNYVGWGVIDQRLVRPGSVPLIGFIYPPAH
jgi:surface antigen